MKNCLGPPPLGKDSAPPHAPPASPSFSRLPPLRRPTAAKSRLSVRGRRTCGPVWAVLSPLSRSRPRSTSLKTPSRLGRQAPGRGELDVRYSTRRSRPSPGCAQARQALPLVRGAQTGRAGPCPPRGGAYCGPKAVPTTGEGVGAWGVMEQGKGWNMGWVGGKE